MSTEPQQTSDPATEICDRLPRTADGVPFFIDDTVYMLNDDIEYWGTEPVLELQVSAISKPVSFPEYRGDYNIIAGDAEGGNLDFYSTREACAAADQIIWLDRLIQVGDLVEVLDEGLALLRQICPDQPPNHHGRVSSISGDTVYVEFPLNGSYEEHSQIAPYPLALVQKRTD